MAEPFPECNGYADARKVNNSAWSFRIAFQSAADVPAWNDEIRISKLEGITKVENDERFPHSAFLRHSTFVL